MNYMEMPRNLSRDGKEVLQEQLACKHWNGVVFSTSFAMEATKINDAKGITNTERENRLINIFAKYNIELTFVD